MTKSRSVLLFLLPAIALAVVVSLWFVFGAGSSAQPVDAKAEAPLAPGPGPAHEPVALVVPGVHAAEDGSSARTALAAVDPAAAGAAARREPDGARHVVAGRVVRVDGTPVTSFSVEAVRFSADGEPKRSVFARGEFEDEDGAFELVDVPSGEFFLVPGAEGHRALGLFQVVVPTSEPVLLELVRAGLITGVVHDAFDQPLPGARVVLGPTEHVCDQAGRFSLPAGTGGPGWIFARAEGFGPSPLREFALADGESAHFELYLTLGATITGQVLDAAGAPDVGLEVALGELRNDHRTKREKLETNELGRFAYLDLPAGSYVILVDESEGAKLRIAQVTVGEGETREVVLDGRVKDPIALRVSFTRADAPVSKATVHAFPEGPGFLANAHKGRPNEDGQFELELDEPGVYLLSVDVRGSPGSMHRVNVPREAVVEMILALPDGRLRGRVISDAGESTAGASVWAGRDGAWNPITLGQGRTVRVDDDGHFEFSGLEAGTWTVRAGGTRARTGLKLEPGGVVEGIELRQEAPGSARGRVFGTDGSPLGGVPVFARDRRGLWVHSYAHVSSRPGTGEFEYPNLPAGDYTFLARHQDQVSAESEPVRVGPGIEPGVELRLQHGMLLTVTLTDRSGEPLPSSFTVHDEHGRSFESLESPHDLELLLEVGPQSNGRFVGPLPHGTYEVRARAHDGRTMTGWSTHSPGGQQVRARLRLQLP